MCGIAGIFSLSEPVAIEPGIVRRMADAIATLLGAGLLHKDARTVAGHTLEFYDKEPYLDGGKLAFRAATSKSRDETVVRPFADPFGPDGVLKVLDGNLGRAVIKISAVAPELRKVRARARIFRAQEEVEAAFAAGELDCDLVVVVRFQGAKAIGMRGVLVRTGKFRPAALEEAEPQPDAVVDSIADLPAYLNGA